MLATYHKCAAGQPPPQQKIKKIKNSVNSDAVQQNKYLKKKNDYIKNIFRNGNFLTEMNDGITRHKTENKRRLWKLSLKLIKFTLTVFWSLVRKPGYKGEENSGCTCGWNLKKGAVGTQ